MRVALPGHLRTLGRVHADGGEVVVPVTPPVTLDGVLDALEGAWPSLAGTIRDRVTGRRRPMVRVYVGEEDRSHEPTDAPLPDTVVRGELPVRVVGAMAGG
ncbi:MoaD/ThiS family protein [Nitriliruptoraceae bacterium ZYF776]|nr:MoaD/ThiS family protein [Profundirhabdus halotolerans]